jgi:PAS domain S-box-containing protein
VEHDLPVARGHSTVVDTASDKSGSTAPINILMVDDTPAKLLTYEVVLHELGENLIKASSVEEALRTLLKVDVALILTDVSMPIVDGFDFAKIVREHPQFRTIPIIFVSAIAHSDLDRLRAYASGAVDYVTVPIAPELLRAKVKVFVDLYRNRRELETLKSELEDRVGKRTAQLEAYTQRLAESEQRYRSLIENANDIVATLDLNLVFTAVNPAVQHILGYTPQELVGTSLTQYVPQKQVAMHAGMLQRKLGGEASARYEMELASKERQRYITLEVSSTLLFDSSGNPVGIHAIARDISERKEAEARQLVLIRELQHRTKNLLAVIQSIVSNTLTRSRDLVSGKDAIIGRLHALARAQEFVVSGTSGGVPLRNLVEEELSAFGARMKIDGIPLIVGSTFGQQFALVIHELATNAAKYGSLSTPKGYVLINWEVKHQPEEPTFVFSWVERGGPPVKPPSEEGFGSSLITETLKGNPRILFGDLGFEFAVEISMADIKIGCK